MDNQNIVEEKPVNKNRTLIIAVVVIVALLCCCLIIGIVGFFSYTMIASATSEPVQAFPTEASEIDTPQFDIGIGDPPSGGLGNDILRNDVWQVMAPVAVGLGCDQPSGDTTTIEVLQEPDTSGVWVEQWTVMCNSGATYAFEVEFILDDTGATFNIKPLP